MLNAFFGELQNSLGGLGADLAEAVLSGAKGVAIAMVAIVMARWLRERVRNAAHAAGLGANAPTLLGNLASIAVYVVGAALIFAALGGNFTASVTLIGAATVAVSLALQDILRSLVAGIYLLIERPFSIGQRISVLDVEGTVTNIDMRTTQLTTDHGGEVFVPNSTVFGSIVINRSTGFHPRLLLTVTGLSLTDPTMADDIPAIVATTEGIRPGWRVTRIERAPAGASLAIELAHESGIDPGHRIAEQVHARFPEATVVVERASA